MKKKIFFATLAILIAFMSPMQVLAQESNRSNRVITRVGNAPESEKPTGRGVAPEPPSDVKRAIKDQFDLNMNGFSEKHLKWAWEKLWDVSGTRFNSLVKGTTINVAGSNISMQQSCASYQLKPDVVLFPYEPEDAFKLIFIHELGHIIRNCTTDRTLSKYNEHLEALNSEGGVSHYARNANSCTGSDTPSEDYADMIAYYLNQETQVGTAMCAAGKPRPNIKIQYPKHYNVVRAVLGDYE